MVIAKKYQDFDSYAVVASQHIGQHWQRLRIDELQKAEMLIAFNEWTRLWYLYIDPKRRMLIVVKQIAVAYNDLAARLRNMVQQIKYDKSFTLTAEDISALRIKVRPA